VALVYIPTPLAGLTGGKSPLQVEGATVREVIDNLERAWPGIRERLISEGRLRSNISVAVDGEVTPLGLGEPVSASSEVHFVAAISGGCGRGPRYILLGGWRSRERRQVSSHRR